MWGCTDVLLLWFHCTEEQERPRHLPCYCLGYSTQKLLGGFWQQDHLQLFLFKPRLISRLPVNSTCHCPSVLILSLGCTIGSPPGDPNCRTFCQLDQHLLRSGTSGHLVHGLYLLSLSMPDTMRMNHHLLCAKPAMPYERYCLPSGPCSFSTRSLFLVLRMKKKKPKLGQN